MINQNKNRGAGLVTVVAVLAIATILLASTIFLAFNQYRNAIRAEAAEQKRVEIDLFAELVNAEGLLPDSDFTSSSLLKAFYKVTKIEGKSEWTFETLAVDGTTSNEKLVIKVVLDENTKENTKVYTVSCGNDVSKAFCFDAKAGNKFVEVES